jgi:hypothetical protein
LTDLFLYCFACPKRSKNNSEDMKEKDNRQEDEKEGGGRRMAKKSRAMRY